MSSLERAIALAATAHEGQTDKAGQPYVLHLLRVMMAQMMGQTTGDMTERATQPAMIAAVLHDIVEDTGYTFEDLREEGFSREVVTAVEHLTRQDGESYTEFAERAASHPVARVVKLADLEDNMDITRLPEVSDRDRKRLAKYHQAWSRLREGQ